MALLSAFCLALDKVLVIGGPTGSGKSTFALELCTKHKGVIINADSLQIYQGLEILTAQPPPQAHATVPHRLYGFLSPSRPCSAGQWIFLALQEIDRALQSGKVPLIVGGTGLYLKALMEGLSPLPPSSPLYRQKLQNIGIESLYAQLQSCDPKLASRLNPQDRQRITRGLEVWHSTGKPLSAWQQDNRPLPPPYRFETYLLMPSKETLTPRLQSRIDHMIALGVLDEVEKVIKQDLSPTASKAIGLRELGGHIEGNYSLQEAKDLTLLKTQHYAKRQATWFRHQFKATHSLVL